MKAHWLIGRIVIALAMVGLGYGQASEQSEVQKLVDGLHFQSGKIAIGDNLATLDLPANLRYLGPQDAETVITKLWGNPPEKELSLGMIVPTDSNVAEEGGWAVLITYVNDGHIKGR